MDEFHAYIWLVTGLVLVLSEIVVPGLVVVFLGAAAILVALGIYLGLLTGWTQILSFWFIASLVLILGLRNFFARLVPGNTAVGSLDEDADALGMEVLVERRVRNDEASGHISFRGSTWSAISVRDEIAAGAKARLVKRDNQVWYVEAVDNSDEN